MAQPPSFWGPGQSWRQEAVLEPSGKCYSWPAVTPPSSRKGGAEDPRVGVLGRRTPAFLLCPSTLEILRTWARGRVITSRPKLRLWQGQGPLILHQPRNPKET